MPKLEPEQFQRMQAELDQLEPILKKTLDEFIEMRDSNMTYVQIITVMNEALESDNFDHVKAMIDTFHEGGCVHMRDQVWGLGLIFFMLGRNVERADIPITTTFV